MYYVYVLKSQLDNKLYIGYSANLKKRFKEHQNGKVKSTKPRRPFELIFYEAYKSKVDAKRREKYFKTDKGKTTIQTMLRDSLMIQIIQPVTLFTDRHIRDSIFLEN